MSVPASIMRSVHQPPTPRPRYPSDLSDTAWSRIRGLVVPTHHKGGRPCSQARWREYVDALLYITRTGCPWRALPHDFTAGWSAAHEHLTKWTRTGLWQRLLRVLREETRTRAGRKPKPTAAIVDSSSVKGMPLAGPRGFDGAKRIDGIKRHILVDTTGLLLAVHVTPANVQDRAAFADLLTTCDTKTVTKVRADKGYTGTAPAEAAADPMITRASGRPRKCRGARWCHGRRIRNPDLLRRHRHGHRQPVPPGARRPATARGLRPLPGRT